MKKDFLLLTFSGFLISTSVIFISAFSVKGFSEVTQKNVSTHSTTPTSTYSPVSYQPIDDDIPKTKDGQHFQAIKKYAIANNLSKKSRSEIIEQIALKLVGSTYEAGLLDKFKTETLFLSLTKFDCVLFVETVLALAKGIEEENYNYSTFASHVSDRRYRDGNLENYCSRLHYFSEWIADNEKRGNVKNLTASLGGIKLDNDLNFMSQNRSKYSQLGDQSNYECIVNMENNLAQLDLNYIPTNNIRQIYPQLRSGDIVAIATKIKGLDVTHTGLIYRHGDNISLIHASPAGKVAIASDLQRYVSRVKYAKGVIIARP